MVYFKSWAEDNGINCPCFFLAYFLIPGVSLSLQMRERTEPLSDLVTDKKLNSEFFSSFFLGQHLEHGPKEGRQLGNLS